MAIRRKVFRVEEMRLGMPARAGLAAKISTAPSRDAGRAATPAPSIDAGVDGLRQLKDETDSIFRAINRTKQEIATLHVGGISTGDRRVRQELDAVVGGAEQAIQQILAAAEEVDEAANTLSAVLKQEQNQALAQDIRDHVIRIFEACNFHDLAGQRISKVLATLQFVEDRVARMIEIWGGMDAFRAHAAVARAEHDQRAPVLLDGPKLAGDPGHASQDDIDAIFRKG
jgi:chemotaxis protein CheZ